MIIHTLRALVTSGRSCTRVTCWSSQLLDVLAKSPGLLELTVLQANMFMRWQNLLISKWFPYLSKLSRTGFIILENTQYFQFWRVQLSTCSQNMSCSRLGWLDAAATADPGVKTFVQLSCLSCPGMSHFIFVCFVICLAL